MLKLCAAAAIGAIVSTVKIPRARAESEPVAVGGDYYDATSTTTIQGDVGAYPVFEARNTYGGGGSGIFGYAESGFGVKGESPNLSGVYGRSSSGDGIWGLASSGGSGVWGNSNSGSGVVGESNTGIGVKGSVSSGASGIPMVAQGASGQTANLQEWQNSSGTALSVVDKIGWLGVGAASPVSPIHVMIPVGQPASLIAIRAEGENRNVGAFFYSYSSGNFPFFSGRRARGTIASPSAVQANDLLMRYGGAGYGATSFPAGNRATLEFYAAENWTDTAQGTYVTIGTTATGSTATTERLRVTGDGNVVPPSDNTGSIGTASKRWALVRAVTITPGDLIFENGVKATEEGDGLAFVNPKGKKVAVLDSEGNFHIKGKIIQDL